MFSRASLRVPVFPRKTLVTSFPRLSRLTCFPALSTGYMFSRLPGAGYMFSRAWHWLHVFHAWQPLHVFPRLATDCTILFRVVAGSLPITSCHLKRCFILLSFQVAPIFLFLCFAVLHSLQTSDESDDLGESAQDKKTEVTRRTEQPEAHSSRIDKPPLRRCSFFLMSFKDISCLQSNFYIC